MAKRKLDNWLTGWLRYMDNTEPPALFKHWTGVSVLAGVLERRVWLDWEGIWYPNHFIVLVGPSASRKGTAMRPGRRLLEESGVTLSPRKITPSRLIHKMAHSQKPVVGMPAEYDTSVVCPITVFSEEFSVFFGYENDVFVDDLCDLYDSHALWDYETHQHGLLAIPGVCLNMLGGTTPDTLRKVMPTRAIGSGLTSRIILVYGQGKEKTVVDPRKTPEEQDTFTKLIQDLKEIYKVQGPFTVTDEWVELYNQFYLDQERNPPIEDRKFESYIGRRQVHLAKLCMIMSVARDDKLVLDATSFNDAAWLLRETEKAMPYVYSGYGRLQTSDIRRQMATTVAHHERLPLALLYEKFQNDATLKELEEILQGFKLMCYLRIELDAKGSRWVTYTPDAYAKWKADYEAKKRLSQLPPAGSE